MYRICAKTCYKPIYLYWGPDGQTMSYDMISLLHLVQKFHVNTPVADERHKCSHAESCSIQLVLVPVKTRYAQSHIDCVDKQHNRIQLTFKQQDLPLNLPLRWHMISSIICQLEMNVTLNRYSMIPERSIVQQGKSTPRHNDITRRGAANVICLMWAYRGVLLNGLTSSASASSTRR